MWCEALFSTLFRWRARRANFKFQRSLESKFSALQKLVGDHQIDFEIEFFMYFWCRKMYSFPNKVEIYNLWCHFRVFIGKTMTTNENFQNFKKSIKTWLFDIFNVKITYLMRCETLSSTLFRWRARRANFKFQRSFKSKFSAFQKLISDHQIDFEIEFFRQFWCKKCICLQKIEIYNL